MDDFKKVKGRRNASEQLLQKKLAGQAYVLKQVVGQGKGIGKKRRARLLSNEDSEMKLNVPYSLNRKNRWEVESSAEYLKDRRSDKHVQLCALDQHLTVKGLSPSKDVLAFHQVDQHGTLNSRKSQSQRGSTLSALSVECEEKPLSIRYVLAKSNPNAKGLIGGSLDKGKKFYDFKIHFYFRHLKTTSIFLSFQNLLIKLVIKFCLFAYISQPFQPSPYLAIKSAPNSTSVYIVQTTKRTTKKVVFFLQDQYPKKSTKCMRHHLAQLSTWPIL